MTSKTSYVSFGPGRLYGIIAILAALLACGTAGAQPVSWSGASDTDWSNAANWGGTAPGASDVGLFSSNGAYSNQPNLTTASAIGALWNTGSAPVSISGSPLTLNSALVNGNTSVGIEMDTGAGSMGIGAPLVLGGAQSWLNNSGNPLAVSANVDNGGNLLTVAGNGNVTISGNLSGAGGLTMNGGGALVLSGNNTYSGDTNVNSGTIVAASPVFGNAAIGGNLYINNGGTVSVTQHDALFGGPPPIMQTATIYAGGMLTSAGAVCDIGAVVLSGGTLAGAGDRYYGSWWLNNTVTATGGALSTMSAAGMTLPQTQTFFVDSGSTLNVTGNFIPTPNNNTGGITKTGPGTMILAGYNTYTGDTTVNGGTLELAVKFSTLGASNLIINNGGTVYVPVQDGLWNGASNAQTLTVNAGGLLTIGTQPNDLGPVVLTGGTLAGAGDPAYGSYWFNGTVSATGSALSTLSSPGMTLPQTQTFFVDSGSTLNVTGNFVPTPIPNTGGITKTGSGTMILAGQNSYTGDTTVDGGTLVLAVKFSTLGASNLIINNGGSVYVPLQDGLWAGASNAHTLTVNAGGLLTIGTQPNDLGPVVLTGGTLAGAGDPSYGSYWFNGTVSTTGSALSTLSSPGMTLVGTQTFFVDSGSTLNVTGSFIPTAANNSGGLVKTGPGMMILANGNSYVGNTTVNGGTLNLENQYGTLPGNLNINNGGTVYVGQYDGLYNIANLKTVTINTGGLLTLYPNPSTLRIATCDIGPLVLAGGTLDGAGDPIWGSWWLEGAVTATGSAVSTMSAIGMTLPQTETFFVDSGSTLNVTGNFSSISGDNPGGIVKTGLGMMVLSGSNTYIGSTTVNDGTLVVQSSDSLPDGSSLLVGDPALLGQFAAPAAALSPGSAVPEPGTAALLAVAGLLLLCRWRR
jgi:fibronectin-binding autotransporter adhesin